MCSGFKECIIDCSVSMGALGSSAALRAAAATSLGLSNSMAASQGRPALPPGLPTSQAASQPVITRPASSTPAPGDHPPQTQPLAKGEMHCLPDQLTCIQFCLTWGRVCPLML